MHFYVPENLDGSVYAVSPQKNTSMLLEGCRTSTIDLNSVTIVFFVRSFEY